MSLTSIIAGTCCCLKEEEEEGDPCWTECCNGNISSITITFGVNYSFTTDYEETVENINIPNEFCGTSCTDGIFCSPSNSRSSYEGSMNVSGSGSVTLRRSAVSSDDDCIVVEDTTGDAQSNFYYTQQWKTEGVTFSGRLNGAGQCQPVGPCPCSRTPIPCPPCAKQEGNGTLIITGNSIDDAASASVGVALVKPFNKAADIDLPNPIFGPSIEGWRDCVDEEQYIGVCKIVSFAAITPLGEGKKISSYGVSNDNQCENGCLPGYDGEEPAGVDGQDPQHMSISCYKEEPSPAAFLHGSCAIWALVEGPGGSCTPELIFKAQFPQAGQELATGFPPDYDGPLPDPCKLKSFGSINRTYSIDYPDADPDDCEYYSSINYSFKGNFVERGEYTWDCQVG